MTRCRYTPDHMSVGKNVLLLLFNMGFKYCCIRLLTLEILISTKHVDCEDFPHQDQRVCGEYLVSGPNYRVSDEQLNASSQLNDLHAAKWGRLNTVYVKNKHIGGWAADTGSKTVHYIEVRLNELSTIQAIATQGRNITGDTQTNPQYVTMYHVYYMMKADTKWVSVNIYGNAKKDFQGNNDSNSIHISKLPYDVNATSVRILLKKWQDYPSMRFDLIGCPVSQEEVNDKEISRVLIGVALGVGVLGISVVTTIGIYVARRRCSKSTAANTSKQTDHKMALSAENQPGPQGNSVALYTGQEYVNVMSGKSVSVSQDPTYDNIQGV